MENSDDNPTTSRARNFVQRFLPPGVTDTHSLLYDWDKKYDYEPSEPDLSECLMKYTELIEFSAGKHILNVLDFELMQASELALSYLNRAQDRILSIPELVKGRLLLATNRIVSDAETFMGGYFRHYDAFKRIASINECLNQTSKN